MSWDRRFTDRMVKREPSLISIAMEYVQSYDGEFEPVVAAREYFLRTGSLPVAQARLVLNCLRSDPDLASMSLRIEADSILQESLNARQVEARRGQIHIVPEPAPEPPKRAYHIEVPATIKRPYGMPKMTNGSIHRVAWAVRKGKLLNDWEARKLPPDQRHLRQWTLVVTWACGKDCESFHLLDEEQMQQAIVGSECRRLCKMGCFPENLDT